MTTMAERLALPGFFPPDAPKAALQVFAQPDGHVELVLKDSVPLTESVPDYYVMISTEYGGDIHLQATARNGHVVQVRNEQDGTQKFVFRIGPPCVTFTPGTYMVRAMVGDEEVYVKALTVLAHPEQIRQAQ